MKPIMNDFAHSDRSWLRFSDAAARHFDFLEGLGFSEIESLPTLKRYGNGELKVSIYHGQSSYELGFQVDYCGTSYSMGELIRAANPVAASQYRSYAATTPENLEKGLSQLEAMVRQYGMKALIGDATFFDLLAEKRRESAASYAAEVLAEHLRPEAEAAFRKSDYHKAAELYDRIRGSLSPVELRKLAFAKGRSRRE